MALLNSPLMISQLTITDIRASRSSVGTQSLTQWFCAIVYSRWFAKTNVSWIYFKLVFLKCSKSQVFETQSIFSPQIKKVTTPSMKTSSIKYQKPDTNRIVGFKSHFQIAGLHPTPSLGPAGKRDSPISLSESQVPGDGFQTLESTGLPQ